MAAESSPITVEVVRGSAVESRHLVDAAVVASDGSVIRQWGTVDHPVMPRSAVKPVQAIPLVVTGAASAYELGHAELALACASHNGERDHVDRVLAWLQRIGLSVDDLECGRQPPSYQPALVELVSTGGRPGPEHNNCSGKHSGFLTVCRHLDLPTVGYVHPDHPLQADHVTPALSEMCRFDVSGQEPAMDGCGIPVWRIPLVNLASGWARLTESEPGRRLLGAMMAEPFFVAGTGRSSTRLMTEARRPVAVKAGAEGVYCGAVVDEGAGLALKVRDGAGRAAEVAMEFVLAELGAVDVTDHRLTNWAGTNVGAIRAAC